MTQLRPLITGDLRALYELLCQVKEREGPAALVPYAMSIGSFAEFQSELTTRDYPPEQRFVLCFEDAMLKGAIGFDRDMGDPIADLEGPYLSGARCSADELFESLCNRLRDEAGLTDLRLIVYSTASRLQEFAERYGFEEMREPSLGMELRRKELRPVDRTPGLQLTDQLEDRFWTTSYDLLKAGLGGLCRTPEELHRRLKDPSYSLRIVYDGPNLVAVALFRNNPERCNLLYFAMAEQARGKGLGRTVLTMVLEELFASQPTAVVTLSVSEKNQAALTLYQNVGFSVRFSISHKRRKLIAS